MKSLRKEWPLVLSIITTALFIAFGERWLADLSNTLWFSLMLGWPFVVIFLSAFAMVRHAESLAAILGEPLGTLVLTVAVTGLEAAMIAAVMYTASGDSAVARDTMFAVVMIVLNGLVGLCLILGGLRYGEQTYNLYGASSFLAVITPIAVLGLVLPAFTATITPLTTSPLHATFLIVMSMSMYGVFLAMQTRSHRDYFIAPRSIENSAANSAAGTETADDNLHAGMEIRSIPYHTVLLLSYLLPVVILAKQLAIPINHGIHTLGAPAALGGLIVAVLVLSPESLAAVRAARANALQRSINIALGSVLASISLTIPAVLVIGFFTHKTIVLGLDTIDIILLALSLVVSIITFSRERVNAVLGAVHMLIFFAYLMLLFDK
jgi:Ca2+:H+ antiporter